MSHYWFVASQLWVHPSLPSQRRVDRALTCFSLISWHMFSCVSRGCGGISAVVVLLLASRTFAQPIIQCPAPVSCASTAHPDTPLDGFVGMSVVSHPLCPRGQRWTHSASEHPVSCLVLWKLSDFFSSYHILAMFTLKWPSPLSNSVLPGYICLFLLCFGKILMPPWNP